MADSERQSEIQPWSRDDVLHAWWVPPHRLLAGEYPGATTPEKAAAKVRLLVEAGVDTIIDLTTEHDGLTLYRDELQGAPEHAGRTVRHFAHPIPDFGVSRPGGPRRDLGAHPPRTRRRPHRLCALLGRERPHRHGHRVFPR